MNSLGIFYELTMSSILALYHYSSFPSYYNTYTVHFNHNNDMMERKKEGNPPLFFSDGSFWGKTRENATDFPAQMEALGIKCLSRSLCLEQNIFGGASPKPPSTYTFPCHLEHYSLTLSTCPLPEHTDCEGATQTSWGLFRRPSHFVCGLQEHARLSFESWCAFLLA